MNFLERIEMKRNAINSTEETIRSIIRPVLVGFGAVLGYCLMAGLVAML